MNKTLFLTLYQDLLKSNKGRKLKLALKENIPDYKNYLREQLGMEAEVEVKPTIHIVQIQDSSGSMFNYDEKHKFDKAVKGIERELSILKKDLSVNYKLTIYEFSTNCKLIIDNKNLCDVSEIVWMKYKRGTALSDSLWDILTVLKRNNNSEVKVLIKVFTDSVDLHSHNKTKEQVRELIQSLPENMTFTFVAAKEDQKHIDAYNVDETNLLFHDNTAEGVMNSFATTTKATMRYSKNVVAGKEVKTGFYKELATN